MNEISRDAVIEYNREMKAFLTEVWEYVPKGRQKQFIKDPRKKALLDRYRIRDGAPGDIS